MTDINTELLYCSYGKALLMLGDYGNARDQLLAAQKIEPNNSTISSELQKVCEQKIILKCSSFE
jgi:Flp pilus assembly protein TadD